MKTKLFERKEYLDSLDAWRDKEVIKVITGVRRCGKSSLLALYIEILRASGVTESNIININLEDMKNRELLVPEALHDYIVQRISDQGTTYVFIDEVQLCPDFERAVVSLNLRDTVDLYITGSNASLLSGDFATLLAGRYVEIEMLPLSFKEYVEFALNGYPNSEGKAREFPMRMILASRDPELHLNPDVLFDDYMRFGGFPYIPMLQKDSQTVIDYLGMIYNTIVLKDTVKLAKVNDIMLLEDIVRFLCSSIGSPISIKKISDTINSAGRKISPNTVEQYIRALTDSFVFYKVDRFDIRGKQHLKTQNKYYIVDSGIRNMLISSSSPDTGHVLENIVFLELLRRAKNKKVNIGKIDDKEVDFVVLNLSGGLSYYQVAASVLNESTLKRELEPLAKIPDHYPKYLLTLDGLFTNTFHNGIKLMNILDWLFYGDEYTR